MRLNEEELNKMIKTSLQKAFSKNLSSLGGNDSVTDNFVSMNKAKNMVEDELEEEVGYSDFLKSDENPEGETEGLTVDVLNKILMKIVQDDKEGGEATEATSAGSSGSFSAPLFVEPKKNNMFQPGTEGNLTTKPKGGPVNEQESDDNQVEPDEVDTEDGQYDFNKGEYEAETKSYVGAYLVGEETPKQLEVYNIRQYPDHYARFTNSGAKPYSMSLHKAKLPLSQIEILGDVPGKDGFKFIRMPYWFFKKNDNDLRIQRFTEPRALYLTGKDYKPEQVEKLFDPMFEKYFDAIVYDELDRKKYDITRSNYTRIHKTLTEGKLKGYEKSDLVRKLMKASKSPNARKRIEDIINHIEKKLNDDGSLISAKYVNGIRVDENEIKGGKADGMDIEDVAKMHDMTVDEIYDEFQRGIKHEMEHTSEMMVALEIALDHLYEDPEYYTKLEGMEGGEATEATTSSSAGVYDAPFGGPKKDPLKLSNPDTVEKELRSVKDKNFPKYGGPGGKFVKIKKKCSKFPYCNQGDINALEFFERDMVKEMISNVATKTNVDEYVVRNIVAERLGFITEQEEDDDEVQSATIKFATSDAPIDKEQHQKDWLESIPDEKARFLLKELKGREFEFKGDNDISGKAKILDVGPMGKIGGFFGVANDYDFGDSDLVDVWVELSDLKYKGQSVPVGFYDMISRYLPPKEEEESYRGNPIERAIMRSMDYENRIMKSLGLYLAGIRINPYARFR